MKSLLSIIFSLAVSVFISCCAFAEDFYIKNYDVNISVYDNNTAHIEEIIDVYFTSPRHGIFRKVPINYKITYPDGESKKAKSAINNVTATDKISGYYYENGNYVIKMGNPNKFVRGDKKYTLSYDYTLANPFHKDRQEFYFNIIGTEWPAEIKKVNFSVSMPKEFNKNDVGISIGRKGTVGFNDRAYFYTVSNNIKGWTKEPLRPNEGITIRVELPKGYFNAETPKCETPLGVQLLMAVFGFIPFIIWFFYGKDDKVISVVNFYPPKNHNSAEIGTEYLGYASEEAVISLIFYLANKGYLEISDEPDNFKINKLKDYDNNNPYEQKLITELFSKKNTVSQKDLKEMEFYKTINEIQKLLDKKIKNRIFDNSATSPLNVTFNIISILAIITLIIYTLFGCSLNILGILGEESFIIVFVIVGFLVSLLGIGLQRIHIFIRIFLIYFGIMFGGIPFIIIYSMLCNIGINIHSTTLIFGFACLILSVICFKNLERRNRKGNRLLGEIMGFKKFLEVAEKHKIETLLKENKNYCYDILPYAYVLGVSDKWIKKFEGILLYKPDWYKGNEFNSASFSTLSNAVGTAVKAPSSSSSGGGSFSGGGGGFSGGGSGGGGGGSW